MNKSYADLPGMNPPLGRLSNFDNPESRAILTIVPNTVSLALMLFFVSLRIYPKFRHRRSLDGSDCACVLAAILAICFVGVTVSALNGPLGKHEWDVRAVSFTSDFSQKEFFVEVVYSPAIFFTKLSLFLLYLRLFSVDLRSRYLIYFGIGLTGIFYSFALIYFSAVCIPRRGSSWIDSLGSSRCQSTKIVGCVQGVINILGDFYLLGLPMPVVWKLHMPRRKKVGVTAVFLMGTFACICSILNLYYRVQLNRTVDNTWVIVLVDVTSIVEINVGIICGCMPLLATMLESQLAKTSDFLSMIKSHISYMIYKRFHYSKDPSRSSRSDAMQQMNPASLSAGEFNLETQLLGSAKGEGNHMGSESIYAARHKSFSLTTTTTPPTPTRSFESQV